MKQLPSLILLSVSAVLTTPSLLAATEIGATLGVSSSNVQVPERIYDQASLLLGAELSQDGYGVFWEANRLKARSGSPPPFHTGGDASGFSHFFGFLVRLRPTVDSKLFFDLKAGANSRSVGAPPPSSDLAPGLGAALGYRLVLTNRFSLNPRIGYRILSYSVNGAAHYAHQGYDLNFLASFSL
jgi:hypothetical protein